MSGNNSRQGRQQQNLPGSPRPDEISPGIRWKKCPIIGLLALLAVGLCFALAAAAKPPEITSRSEPEGPSRRTTDQAGSQEPCADNSRGEPGEVQPGVWVKAVGDVNMGRAWPKHRAKLPPHNALDLFQHVREELVAADVAFGNLETVLKDSGKSSKCGRNSRRCFAFRVPTAFAEALRWTGFDVMSLANNHAGDFGEAGRRSTAEALDRVGILHSGALGDIASWKTKGAKGIAIGLVAFSTGGGAHRLQDIAAAKETVARIDLTHDLVIVSFHGGAEGAAAGHVPHGTEIFLNENRGDLRAFTHAVIDAGADLVLGHGPHRLRGMEIYRGRLIAYSLGNFSSWGIFRLKGPTAITVILATRLGPTGELLQARLIPIVIKWPGRPHIDQKGRAITIVRNLSREDFGSALFDEQGRLMRQRPSRNSGDPPCGKKT